MNLSIHCNEEQAMLLATMVDHEGRTSVRSGSEDFCNRAREEIQVRFCVYEAVYEVSMM